jgi:hypothetical protein
MIVIHHTLSRQYGATKIAISETFRPCAHGRGDKKDGANAALSDIDRPSRVAIIKYCKIMLESRFYILYNVQ